MGNMIYNTLLHIVLLSCFDMIILLHRACQSCLVLDSNIILIPFLGAVIRQSQEQHTAIK